MADDLFTFDRDDFKKMAKLLAESSPKLRDSGTKAKSIRSGIDGRGWQGASTATSFLDNAAQNISTASSNLQRLGGDVQNRVPLAEFLADSTPERASTSSAQSAGTAGQWVKSVVSQAWNDTLFVGAQLLGFGKGFLERGLSLITGIPGTVEVLLSAEQRERALQQVRQNPWLLVDGFTKDIREDWDNERYGEALGAVGFEVITLFGVGAIVKAGKGAEVLGGSRMIKAAEGLETAGNAGRISKAAEVVDGVGDVSKAVKASEIAKLGTRAGEFTKVANVPGADTLIEKLLSKSDSIVKGANYELEYAVRHTDDISEMGKVFKGLKGGKKEIDFVLKDNTFVNMKDFNWPAYNAGAMRLATEDMVEQALAFRLYNPTAIKYVFRGSVPESVRKALENVGVIVEVWP